MANDHMHLKIQNTLKKYDARVDSYQKIQLSDISKYSPWPKRLLGLEEYQQRSKTKDEILREYEREKWGKLLKDFNQNPWRSFQEFRDNVDNSSLLMPRSWKEELFFLKELDFSRFQADVLADILTLFMPTGTVVELGCGFGAMLLDMAGRDNFKHVRFIGGDITPSGVELLNILAKRFGLAAQAHQLDVENFDKSIIPSDSLIFSSFSLSCVHGAMEKIIANIMSVHPKVVIHLEPVHIRSDQEGLLSLMRKRYLELNGYNGDLRMVLKDLEKLGLIRILVEVENLLGGNPFIPVSLLIWELA